MGAGVDEMSEHAEIFLQPECCADPEFGRAWCDTDSPEDCSDGVPWTAYMRKDLHAAELEILRAQLADEKRNCTKFENAHRESFNRRAKSVTDLQQAVWKALDRKACPGAWLTIVADTILENGCAEIADAKNALAAAREQIERFDTKDAAIESAGGGV